MDGFCWLGELDLTLFYTIEGYFDNLKSLMTENERVCHKSMAHPLLCYLLYNPRSIVAYSKKGII